MITEDQLEQHAIQWFQDTGWNYVHGAVIAPEGGAAEREDRGNIEHRTLNIERRSEEKRSLAEAVQHMAELFQTTKQNIAQHLKSIFAEEELALDSVVKDSFTTAADGKNYATRFYNLDAIISEAVIRNFRITAKVGGLPRVMGFPWASADAFRRCLVNRPSWGERIGRNQNHEQR